MAGDFWIDQSDPPYPAIKHRLHPDFDKEVNVELMTLTRAKRELKAICRSHRQHWLAVMHYQTSRDLRAITAEAVEARNTRDG